MDDTNNSQHHPGGARPSTKRSLSERLARRQEQLEALRAKAAVRRQKEKETKEALIRQMAQLQARERRRTREIERGEAQDVVRCLGTLALDALIQGQAVGATSIMLNWTAIAPDRRALVERVVKRGQAQGGAAADMTAESPDSTVPGGDASALPGDAKA